MAFFSFPAGGPVSLYGSLVGAPNDGTDSALLPLENPNFILTPASGALVAGGLQPDVNPRTITITPAAGALNLALVNKQAAPSVARARLQGETAGVVQGTVITPATGALVAAGQTPQLIQGTGVIPTLATLVFGVLAPVITLQLAAAPSAGSLTLAGQTAGVSQGTVITPAAGALNLSLPNQPRAPSAGQARLQGETAGVLQGTPMTPAVGALALAGQVPSLSTSGGGVAITPTAGALVLAGQSTSTGSVLITPTAGSLILENALRSPLMKPAAAAPAIAGQFGTWEIAFPPVAPAALALTGFAPTVTGGVANTTIAPKSGDLFLENALRNKLTINKGALALAGSAPVLNVGGGSGSQAPPAAAEVLAGQFATWDIAFPPITRGQLVLAGSAPVVTQSGFSNVVITPASGQLILENALRGRLVVNAGALGFTRYAPVINVGASGSSTPPAAGLVSNEQLIYWDIAFPPVTPGALSLAGLAPVVGFINGSPTITPAAGALTLAGQTPALIRIDVLRPTTGALALSGQFPVLGSLGAITVQSGALALAGQQATVIVPVFITPAAGALALAGQAPQVSQQILCMPSSGALALSGIAPIEIRYDTIRPDTGALVFTGGYPGMQQPIDAVTLAANWELRTISMANDVRIALAGTSNTTIR